MENMVLRDDFSTLAVRGVREGRIARSRGAPRDDNPYRALQSRGPVLGFGSLGQARLKSAWWQGWDQADAELR
jgi:hypothetical protein